MRNLWEITAYLDQLLQIQNFKDYPGAHNGLQLESAGEVKRIVAAVDACEAVIDQAVHEKASLLIVHHGLLWSGTVRWVGANYRKLSTAIAGGLAIYSVHLPLDAHPQFGNNVLLARACKFTEWEPFLEYSGTPVGVRVTAEIQRAELLKRVKDAVGGGLVQLVPGGPEICRSIAIVTGGAGTQVSEVATKGIDTFITGEGPHWTYTAAEEAKVNLIYAGHYATETFGVRAIAQHISERFQLPWSFIDHPTGR